MANKYNHCWIREIRDDGSFHRVGCITMKKMNATSVKIAYSLCAPEDRHLFDLNKAKGLAIQRLGVEDGKIVNINDVNKIDWANTLGISRKIMKHTKAGRNYAWDRNNSAIAGLLSEVTTK